MKPKITFPYWGNYTIAFESWVRGLGLEVVVPEKTNQSSVEKGARIAPEMYCLPLKANLGNYIGAIEKGANTIIMVTSMGGSCRLRYYADIQKKVLAENGQEVDFITFDQSPIDIYRKIRAISGAPFLKILRALWFGYRKLRLIEKLERRAQYIRPREKNKGEADLLLREAFAQLKEIDTFKGLNGLEKKTRRRISGIKLEKRDVLRVGIVGEIFTVSDPSINHEIEKNLGQEGVEVHREMDITYHLKKQIFPWKDGTIQKKIMPYLGSTVGGHGRDAIYEMLEYVKKGFDGVIQLLPFACMPESSVRPILEKIHQDSGIPFLSLSLDEEVAEAGIQTRLEAFVDVVREYHKNKSKIKII